MAGKCWRSYLCFLQIFSPRIVGRSCFDRNYHLNAVCFALPVLTALCKANYICSLAHLCPWKKSISKHFIVFLNSMISIDDKEIQFPPMKKWVAALIWSIVSRVEQMSGCCLLLQFKTWCLGVPVVAQWLTNPTKNHEVAGSVPALAQWVNDLALPWAVV